jgi:putative transposase
MSQSLADIITHIVFSTKNRHPWIKPDIENELYQYICGISRNLNCPIIKINGVEDHIHILAQLGKTIAISKLISEIKSNSSRWLKAKGREYQEFSWQNGYGGFSVSRSNLEKAKGYLLSQKEHHKKMTFKEELVMFLQQAGISYDEKYLWD